MFSGQSLSLTRLEDGLVQLTFDLQGESVNKFNQATSPELKAALDVLSAEPGVRGLLLTSQKSVLSAPTLPSLSLCLRRALKPSAKPCALTASSFAV